MSWEDHAEHVLDVDADRPEWLALRKTGIGGSDARVLMGHGYADESEFSVLQSKLYDLPERPDNIRFRRGNHAEVFIAQEFQANENMYPLRTGTWRSKEYPFLLANPDWRVGPLDAGPSEFEYGMESKHLDNYGYAKAYRMLEGAPPRFYWQCIHYMATTGAPGWWLCMDSPYYDEIQTRYLDRDEVAGDIDQLVNRCGEWWESHVVNGFGLVRNEVVEPTAEIVKDKVAEAALPDFVLELLEERRTLKFGGTTAGKTRIASIDLLLEQQIGDAARLAVDGVEVLRWQTRSNPGKVNWPALEAELPGAKAKFTESGSTSRFLVEISPTKED